MIYNTFEFCGNLKSSFIFLSIFLGEFFGNFFKVFTNISILLPISMILDTFISKLLGNCWQVRKESKIEFHSLRPISFSEIKETGVLYVMMAS